MKSFINGASGENCRNRSRKKIIMNVSCAKSVAFIPPARSVHHVQWVRKHPRLAMSRTYTYNGKEYVNLIPLCEACHNEQHPDKRVKTEFKKEHFVNEERW